MVDIPAICDNCNTIFPSGIAGDGGSVIILGNTKCGPCPKCGGTGHAPDGTFKLLDNVIEILSAPERTFIEMEQFSLLLKKAQEKEISIEELEKETSKKLPNFKPLLEFVLPENRPEKFQFGLAILTTTLNIFMNSIMNGNSAPPIEPETIINNVYNIEEQNVYHYNSVEKVGRNKPCPCGSNVKYKKCHGR